jgi:hypothetical protein
MEGIPVKYSISGVLALAALATAMPPQVVAQTDQGQVYAARLQLETDRAQVVADNLTLTSSEGTAFWPVYRAYRNDMHAVGDKVEKLIDNFGKVYTNLADSTATRLLNDWLGTRKERLDIRTSYVPKFMAVIPARKVARFYQIENKMDAIVAYAAAGSVPLAMTTTHKATPPPAQ